MNLRRLALASVLALAGGAALYSVRARPSSPTTVAATARSPHEAWRAGSAYTYAVAWDDDAAVSLQGAAGAGSMPAMKGSLAIHGELTLRCLGEKDGAFVLAASLARLDAHRVEVLGSDPMEGDAAARATLEGREAIVAIDPAGVVRSTRVPADAPELFGRVMSALLGQLTATLPGDERAEWTATEEGPRGRAQVRYSWSGGAVARTRTAYETLAALPAALTSKSAEELVSTSEIAVSADGTLTSIDDRESIAVRSGDPKAPPSLVGTTTFTLKHLRTTSFDVSSIAIDDTKLRVFGPGAPEAEAPGERREEHAMTGLAGNLTLQGIEEQLVAVGGGAPLPRTFATRAAAFLRLHPEACDELGHQFADDALGVHGRELVTDLLAGAGHARAQSVLRGVLASPEAKQDPASYVRMVQRFSFVAKPAPESVAMLRELYASAHAAKRTDDARAAAYALGATAHQLAAAGDRDAARATVTALGRDLASAKGADEKVALVTALGNAKLAETEPMLAKAATDDDDAVRAAAANALRAVDTDTARDTLVDLLDDASPVVERAAIAALKEQPLSDDDVSRVASMVARGGTAADLDTRLVTFFAAHDGPKGPILAAIDAMTARAEGDAQLTLRLQALRAQVAGG